MNGNFEVDKGSYPYSGITVGENLKLHHVPTLQRILNVPLPRELSAAVALRLNTMHYAAKAGGPAFMSDLGTVKRIVGEELTRAVQAGLVQGHVATQIQQLTDAATE